MNTAEGIRRIATAIRWVGDGIGALVVLGTLALNWDRQPATLLEFLAIAGVCAAIVVGAGRLLSWIILGFAEPTKKD